MVAGLGRVDLKAAMQLQWLLQLEVSMGPLPLAFDGHDQNPYWLVGEIKQWYKEMKAVLS